MRIRGRFTGPILSEDERAILQAQAVGRIFVVFLLAVGLLLLYVTPFLLFVVATEGFGPGMELLFIPGLVGWFALRWAQNLSPRWRWTAGIVSFAYTLLGGITWLVLEKPRFGLVAVEGKLIMLFMVMTAIVGALLFLPVWYEERTRALPAPRIRGREGTASTRPRDPGHQLPSSVTNSNKER